MATTIPISLRGDNLGERHRHLNTLVQDAYKKKLPLEYILELPEISRIDKLFKIDLASKHRNVDFIVETLKHEDMLYVTRALRCTWLLDLEHQDIINPNNLESELYPHMITPAVNKMKHWIQIKLREPQRCQEFYEYYNNDYDMKIKFLWHCNREFIMAEFLHIIDKVTPKQLKILCEYCPHVVRLYYDNFTKNSDALKHYLRNEQKYYDCSKYILNVEPDTYFEILEKYYDHNRLGPLSAVITEHIMNKHKQRFFNKSELYTAWLLDTKTIAKHLNNDEIKQLVLKLARAEYLDSWFSYKRTEPFIKRLNIDERAAFKKRVFVHKDIGDKIKNWPYPTPSRPEMESLDSVFDDIKYRPEDYKFIEQRKFKRCIQKRKCCMNSTMMCAMDSRIAPRKTMLDELFDRYRFLSFERTMIELRKLLRTESSPKNREFMMLVLVSKCGENMDQVVKLLNFLVERHYNEPCNLRATIVRSLVVRACVWRVSDAAWSLLLSFGRDIGLDGTLSLICIEGMHAFVLRVLLSGEEYPQALRLAFLDNFSTFTEYKLNKVEVCIIRERLPAFLLAVAAEDPSSALDRFELLLNTLYALKVPVKDCPGAVESMVAAVQCKPTEAEYLLRRIYNERFARRALFHENFTLFKTEESYLNVLRHHAALLKTTDEFEKTLRSHFFRYDGFLRKLALYFGEENGLAAIYIEVITKVIINEPHVCLARPLALLRAELQPIINEYIREPKGSRKKQLAATLQSNYHLTKLIDIDTTDWQSIGVKSVANRSMTCKSVDVEKYIQKSLNWRRTLKVALFLAERGNNPSNIYKIVATKRPGAAVRSALSYFKRNKSNEADIKIWSAVAPALHRIDLSIEQRRHLRKTLAKADFLPPKIQIEYWTDVFKAFQKVSRMKALPILCRLENQLSEVHPDIIRNVLEDFFDKFTVDVVSQDDYQMIMSNCMIVRIIAKYLLLSKSESEQKDRLENIWVPFRNNIASLLKQSTIHTTPYINEFVKALKYNKAFFNTTISCLPVLERIVMDLRKLLPMEGFIQIFVLIHATMLYYKSIETCLKLHPEKFENIKTKQTEGAVMVGNLFGNYVGKEIRELVSNYFKSIVTLYQENLIILLRDHIEFNSNRNKFITAFINGLIDVNNTEALLVAVYILYQENCRHDSNFETEKLLNRLKEANNKEIEFFLYANMFSSAITEVW